MKERCIMTMTTEQTNGVTKSEAKPETRALATTSETNGMNAYASGANFEAGQRMAKSLAASSMVPKQYMGNVANCLIAMELASRVGVSVFAVMQNLDIIHGRPGWRGAFLIATVNASGKFSPLRFRWEENGEPTKPGDFLRRSPSFGCRAYANDLKTGEELVGPLISREMVKAEGWDSKPGSKWITLPELMYAYRAGAFWTRIYAPEMSLGMTTAEEAIDTTGVDVTDRPTRMPSTSLTDLEGELLGAPAPSEPEVAHDADGVVGDKGE